MPVAQPRRRLPTACALTAAALLVPPLVPAAASPAPTLSVAPLAPAPAAESPAVSVWERAFYKMLTYEAAANTSDVIILSALVGEIGAGFIGLNIMSAAAAYYTHEVAWALLGPPAEQHTIVTTAVKATTYRLASLSRSYGIAYLFSGGSDVAASFAVIGNVADTVIYLGNEWAWNVLAPPVRPTEAPEAR